MAAKRPTGELPKRLSKQAKLFKGDPNVNSAEAATYAGRNRDLAKKRAASAGAMKTSAASHQRSLAKMSGNTAARDKAAKMEKAKNTFGIMDQTGAAKGRAESKALKSFGLKAEPYKAKTKLKQTNLDKTAGSRSKAGASTAAAVAKRFGVTAREARDIATAFGTYQNSASRRQADASSRNLIKQIKETGTAARTGKKGTTSDQLTIKMQKGVPNVYTRGTKRK